MRKKLLALLMCATMVLGSSAVAFATPSTDDYKAATKVLTDWTGFASELELSNVTTKVPVAGYSDGTYGFVTAAYTNGAKTFAVDEAVKLKSSTEAYLYVGDALDLTSYGTITEYLAASAADGGVTSTTTGSTQYSVSDGVITPDTGKSLNLSILLQVYAARQADPDITDADILTAIADQTYEGKTNTDLSIKDGVIVKIKDSLGVHVRYLKLVTAGATNAATFVMGGKTDLTSDTVYGQTVYKTNDGYAFVAADSKPSLKKAAATFDSNGYTYAYNLTEITKNDADYSDLYLSTAEALADGTLSSDARAARITLYQIYTLNGTPKITTVTYPSSGVSIPVSNDLLSRTKLKAATIDAFYVSGTQATDSDINKAYGIIYKAASNLDASAAYKTFDLPLTASTAANGYVVIFDKSTDESNNDGVASEDTTTAASQTAASSPKTGDVAPIAALAVVMMGACGAMVVASKKRA